MLYSVLIVGCGTEFSKKFQEQAVETLHCDVLAMESGEEAVEKLKILRKADLLIMEAMMSGMDGYKTLAEIRKFRDIPVILLSGRDDVSDKLYAFESGANDYLVKPVDFRELIARSRALIQLYTKYESRKLEFDGLEIDVKGRFLVIDGQSVYMNVMDFDLLKCLAIHAGVALSRRELLNQVWGYDYNGVTRVVDTHIKLIRKALGRYRDRILSHREFGYMFRFDEKTDIPGGWHIE